MIIGWEALLIAVLKKNGPVKFSRDEIESALHREVGVQVWIEGPNFDDMFTIGVVTDDTK